MTTAMEQAIAALAPFAKQAASLPSHDDHVTVFGVALGDCRAAARALAALRADPLRRASAARQERAQEELETTIAAAVAAEREACAQIADEKRDDGLNADLLSEPILWVDGYEHGCCDVATAIRARSEPKTGGVA